MFFSSIQIEVMKFWLWPLVLHSERICAAWWWKSTSRGLKKWKLFKNVFGKEYAVKCGLTDWDVLFGQNISQTVYLLWLSCALQKELVVFFLLFKVHFVQQLVCLHSNSRVFVTKKHWKNYLMVILRPLLQSFCP